MLKVFAAVSAQGPAQLTMDSSSDGIVWRDVTSPMVAHAGAFQIEHRVDDTAVRVHLFHDLNGERKLMGLLRVSVVDA